MNSSDIKERLRRRGTTAFDLYERRPGNFQLIAPIMHEDGDMVDVHLRDSPKGDGYVRVCDFRHDVDAAFIQLRRQHTDEVTQIREHHQQQWRG